ncbi:glutamine--fructose-6-phosphate transaminase (isomerizing) [Candidatus Pacearchaeota archaeon ex4484_71]|nr:MAG: glutamine--fructose-6-phosphate transaminase (isomerizing) [Candidatus Pacearchaeota archaeon ex4484_71]
MCGIIGYIGERNAREVILEGLKKLEYRGYDSAGISIISKNSLKTVKKVGRIKELEKDKKVKDLFGKIGIGHTRWATHGKPSEKNSHPHLDCKKKIAIVHNGIIENYQSLKKLLISEKHKFNSDTDSEIISHLIEKFYEDNLEEAVIKALRLLEGTFGLAVISKDKEEVIAAKRGSPLVIGIGKNEKIISSDVAAVLKYTDKVIYLKDDEVAVVHKKTVLIRKINGQKVDPKIHKIKWDIKSMEKGRFKHFMLKEIFEQPETIRNALRGRLSRSKIKILDEKNVRDIKRIILTACGTSWHSALIGKYLIERIAKIPVEVDYASEFRYRKPLILEGDLLVAISQSGETADTLAAIREAKKLGASTMGIVNVVGSTISREVDFGIYLHAGPETGVASTKAFTSQVTALLLFSLFLAQTRSIRIPCKTISELKKLPKKVKDVLKNSKKIREISKSFKDSKNFLYFGRGINFPVALEGALKLKEISYIHAEGYPAAEMKHGPIALIDKEMPVVFVATKSELSKKIVSNIEEVKSRGGRIIIITNPKNKELKKFAEYVIEVPSTDEAISPIINVIALQLLAYHIADLKNLDVDKPRNLAKSVTVE